MKTLAPAVTRGSYLQFSPSKFRATSTTSIRALAFFSHQKQFSFGTISLSLISSSHINKIYAIPSEITDDEGQELQITNNDQEKTVRVRFVLQKQCGFGEQFLIVGDDPIIASWKPSDGVPLNWSEGHVWTVELDMPCGKVINYKFLLEGITGTVLWQPGPDRILETWETEKIITVFEDWDSPEQQNVVESDVNEESFMISSGLMTVDENLSLQLEEESDLGEELVDETGFYKNNAETISAPLVAENILVPEEDLSVSSEGSKSDIELVSYSNLVSSDDEPKLVYEGVPVLVPGLVPVEPQEVEEASVDEVETDDAESVLNALKEVEELTVPDEVASLNKVETDDAESVLNVSNEIEELTVPAEVASPNEVETDDAESVSNSLNVVEELTVPAEVASFNEVETDDAESSVSNEVEELTVPDEVASLDEVETDDAESVSNEVEKLTVPDETAEAQQVSTTSQQPTETTEKTVETTTQVHDNEESESSIPKGDMQWGRQTLQKFLACLGFQLSQ